MKSLLFIFNIETQPIPIVHKTTDIEEGLILLQQYQALEVTLIDTELRICVTPLVYS
jgi:hypothetical protein